MIDIVKIEEIEDYEFDLEEIGLANHYLIIDSEEGMFIRFFDSLYFIDSYFLQSESLTLLEETNSAPPMIFTIEQKELIMEIFQKILNYTNIM
jgi:hypothetical protein